MSDNEKKPDVTNSVMRGLLIGGSIGIIGTLLDVNQAILLGLLMGCLAGFTHYKIQQKKK